MTYASVRSGPRRAVALPARSRRRCICGQRATHTGTVAGVALMTGCRWCVRLWCRRPDAPRAREVG